MAVSRHFSVKTRLDEKLIDFFLFLESVSLSTFEITESSFSPSVSDLRGLKPKRSIVRLTKGISGSRAVEHTPRDQEAMGLNPNGLFLALLSFIIRVS